MAGQLNTKTGLPPRLVEGTPEEMARVIDLILQVLREWNGESGDPAKRLVTKGELDNALP